MERTTSFFFFFFFRVCFVSRCPTRPSHSELGRRRIRLAARELLPHRRQRDADAVPLLRQATRLRESLSLTSLRCSWQQIPTGHEGKTGKSNHYAELLPECEWVGTFPPFPLGQEKRLSAATRG